MGDFRDLRGREESEEGSQVIDIEENEINNEYEGV
jgi:hypothetical protein